MTPDEIAEFNEVNASVEMQDAVDDSMPPLREALAYHRGKGEANWKLSQFSHFEAWQEVTQMKRAITELQQRVDWLMEERNKA